MEEKDVFFTDLNGLELFDNNKLSVFVFTAGINVTQMSNAWTNSRDLHGDHSMDIMSTCTNIGEQHSSFSGIQNVPVQQISSQGMTTSSDIGIIAAAISVTGANATYMEIAIHIIRTLMEKYRERQKDMHLAFLDLGKAYDSVLRELIWKTLRDKGTLMKYIKVIQDMYEGVRTCV
ncbi:hypothetical protein Tco_1577213 [Tanacetum coccineum]